MFAPHPVRCIQSCSGTISKRMGRNINNPLGIGSAQVLVSAALLARRNGSPQYTPHRSIIAFRQWAWTKSTPPQLTTITMTVPAVHWMMRQLSSSLPVPNPLPINWCKFSLIICIRANRGCLYSLEQMIYEKIISYGSCTHGRKNA